jgi:hypothetical protein
LLLFDFVVAYSKTPLKKDAEVTYFSNAKSRSLGIRKIFQISIVPTEMVLEVEAVEVEDPRSVQHEVPRFHLET